jgi:AraC-like DNA-binding protein
LLRKFVQRYGNIRLSPKPVGRKRLRAELVREYRETHLAENISLDRLAQIACLSPYHLHRIFCHEIGLAPYQYQIQARITRAKKLLREGKTLKKVAQAKGFADSCHLTRHFKRFVHLTPGKYLSQK